MRSLSLRSLSVREDNMIRDVLSPVCKTLALTLGCWAASLDGTQLPRAGTVPVLVLRVGLMLLAVGAWTFDDALLSRGRDGKLR